jgi:hypothetical protein
LRGRVDFIEKWLEMEPMIISGVLLPLAQMEATRTFLESQGWGWAESAQGVNLRVELKTRPALSTTCPTS